MKTRRTIGSFLTSLFARASPGWASVAVASLALNAAGPALAQQSTTYKIDAATFNAAGRPASGVVAQSASYTLSLDSIGDAVTGLGVNSPGFAVSGGLVGSFPPAGEIGNLRFSNATTLLWDADGSGGDYALYQGALETPFDLGFGSCAQPPPAITVPTATVTSVPTVGHALFYLVTARNRLHEEGTKGFTSAGAQRANPAPCP